jgi:prepilin-type N-terminal cleavage/methylation domain-containing protein
MDPMNINKSAGSFNCRGLTLLENLVAMLIFTVVLLGAASMQIHSVKINAEARRDFSRSMVATEYLETLLALPFDDPLLTDPDDGFAPAVADHGPFKILSGRGTVEWEVDGRLPVRDAKRVSITIRTPDDPGCRKAFTYEYMKTKGFK